MPRKFARNGHGRQRSARPPRATVATVATVAMVAVEARTTSSTDRGGEVEAGEEGARRGRGGGEAGGEARAGVEDAFPRQRAGPPVTGTTSADDNDSASPILEATARRSVGLFGAQLIAASSSCCCCPLHDFRERACVYIQRRSPAGSARRGRACGYASERRVLQQQHRLRCVSTSSAS